MRNVTAPLLALLGTRKWWQCDLYTFTLVGGGVLRYATGDADVTWDGNTYSWGGTTGPYFYRAEDGPQATWKTGLEVNTLTVDIVPGDAQVSGVPMLAAIRYGLFDAADVLLQRAYAPTQGAAITGVITLFNGRMVEVSPAGSSKFTMTLNSYTELLDVGWPKNLYQAGCLNTLGDTACGVNLAALAVAGTAASGSTAISIAAALAQATDYFTFGKITFTSGANAGQSRGVRQYTKGSPNSTIKLISPFANAPTAGDTFNIFPGCDKKFSTCHAKFANLDNFRGFPYVPENSTAV